MIDQKDTLHFNGHLRMRERDKASGVILSDEGEGNVITTQGASIILNRMTQDTGGSFINTIYLGDDVGDGNLLAPAPEQDSFTGATQAIVYSVPYNDINIIYPDPYTFEVTTVLDGTSILDNNFPQEIDLRFTSATLRFDNLAAFAYKRFPVRSLSRLVDIEMIWTVSLIDIAQ